MRTDKIDYTNIFNASASNNLEGFCQYFSSLLDILKMEDTSDDDKREAKDNIMRALDGFSDPKVQLDAVMEVYSAASLWSNDLMVRARKKACDDVIDKQPTPKDRLDAAIRVWIRISIREKDDLEAEVKAGQKAYDLIDEQKTPQEQLLAAIDVYKFSRLDSDMQARALKKILELIDKHSTPKEKLSAILLTHRNALQHNYLEFLIECKALQLIDAQPTPQEELECVTQIIHFVTPSSRLMGKALQLKKEIESEIAGIKPRVKNTSCVEPNVLSIGLTPALP